MMPWVDEGDEDDGVALALEVESKGLGGGEGALEAGGAGHRQN